MPDDDVDVDDDEEEVIVGTGIDEDVADDDEAEAPIPPTPPPPTSMWCRVGFDGGRCMDKRILSSMGGLKPCVMTLFSRTMGEMVFGRCE